jgi:hypothetical protein
MKKILFLILMMFTGYVATSNSLASLNRLILKEVISTPENKIWEKILQNFLLDPQLKYAAIISRRIDCLPNISLTNRKNFKKVSLLSGPESEQDLADLMKFHPKLVAGIGHYALADSIDTIMHVVFTNKKPVGVHSSLPMTYSARKFETGRVLITNIPVMVARHEEEFAHVWKDARQLSK